MRQYPALYGACRTASRFSASSRKGLDDSDVVLRQEDAGDTRVEQIGGGFGGGGISVAETGALTTSGVSRLPAMPYKMTGLTDELPPSRWQSSRDYHMMT